MECIIFVGLQATGKSTFYKTMFLGTHVHINLDKLRTRNRESVFLEACFQTQMPFVVDNTNPTLEDRQRYISLAQRNEYKIIGYYFQSRLDDALLRNRQRANKIPEIGLRSVYSKLIIPSYEEGFDKLFYVQIEESDFVVKEWQNEI